MEKSLFVRACSGLQTPQTPIWLNRQAGRYMPEYHRVKGKTPSLDFFKNPELSAEVTCDAQRILDVDAAILFADLLPILEPMGFNLDYFPEIGPVIENPIRSISEIDSIKTKESSESMPYIREAIKLIKSSLPANIPLIGFGGAPFTLTSYAIEGGSSKSYIYVKKLMSSHPKEFSELMDKMTDSIIDYLNYQILSGVDAIQVFDSWVGCLGVSDYEKHVYPHTKRLFESLIKKVPIIHFGTGNPALLRLMAAAGGDVMALDWRAPLKESWNDLGCKSIQGNLDPVALFGSEKSVIKAAKEILDDVAGRPGHIFNLGHGILPQTPLENVKLLVRVVKDYSSEIKSRYQSLGY